jgi:hypothetical protein
VRLQWGVGLCGSRLRDAVRACECVLLSTPPPFSSPRHVLDRWGVQVELMYAKFQAGIWEALAKRYPEVDMAQVGLACDCVPCNAPASLRTCVRKPCGAVLARASCHNRA